MRELKNGDGFGEQALLRNMRRTATVVAKNDCDVLVIEKKDFVMIFEKYKRSIIAKERLLSEVFPLCKEIAKEKIL